MDAKELRAKTASELKDILVDFQKELFGLRMKKSTGQLRTTHELKIVKGNIARVLTIMTEKEAAAGKEGVAS